MIIRTITCHDVYNAGAGLQAYALAEYLKSLGHDAKIIDYKPDYLSNHFPTWGVDNPRFDKPLISTAYNLAKLPRRIKAKNSDRKKAYDEYTSKVLDKTIRYNSLEELKNSGIEADVFFAGSDQIWNPLFPNGRDGAFFLEFANEGAVKASYAASFGTGSIPEDAKAQMAERIKTLDFVSVREESGAEIVKGFGREDCERVLDPVFLLGKEKWEEIMVKAENVEPYILVYDFDNNLQLKEFAVELAKKNGWKIYSVLGSDFADRSFADAGPLQFVSLVANAEFVVSNSFHATAFSLIFNKEFAVFRRTENLNARMEDLLKMTGLSERMVSGACELEAVDYEKANELLQAEVIKSKDFIDRVIKSKVG